MTTSANSKSFVLEEFILQIQTIQYQLIAEFKYFEKRWDNGENKHDQLKTHPLMIIDPYGNATTEQYLDHERIRTSLEKFKKNFVPRYLHQWIRFGRIVRGEIALLKESELNSTISQYQDKDPLTTYGEIIVWFADQVNILPPTLVLKVCLMDNLEKIQKQITRFTGLTNMELKACFIDQDTKLVSEKSWNEGTILKSEDTIMSKKLYQDGSAVVAKIDMDKVNHRRICLFVHDFLFFID